MQEDILNTSLNDLSIWDEALKNYVDSSPKMYILHENTLVQESDVIEIFCNGTLTSIHSNNLSFKYEELVNHAFPSPKIGHTHEKIIVKEDDTTKTFLSDTLPTIQFH